MNIYTNIVNSEKINEIVLNCAKARKNNAGMFIIRSAINLKLITSVK